MIFFVFLGSQSVGRIPYDSETFLLSQRNNEVSRLNFGLVSIVFVGLLLL